LLHAAQGHAAATLAAVCAPAVARLLANAGKGKALFNQQELDTLAEALAGTLAAADLLGRARLRELVRSPGTRRFADAQPVAAFAEFADPIPVLSPEAALDYFRGLVPTLGVDPQRYGEDMRRQAFTLAVATEQTLLDKVKGALTDFLAGSAAEKPVASDPLHHEILLLLTSFREKTLVPDLTSWLPTASEQEVRAALHTLQARGQVKGTPQTGYEATPDVVQAMWHLARTPGQAPAPPRLDTPRVVAQLLDAAGVTPANPGYAEMVVRTNANDFYNQGAWEEFRSPDVQEEFPAWAYMAVKDSRSRPHHAERDGQVFPATRTFNEVRGTDISEIANCRCSFRPLHKSETRVRP
jgi:SPP1 gp7 family putative phage head morphogenesis protein